MKDIGGQNGLLSETQNTHSNKSTLIPLFLALFPSNIYSPLFSSRSWLANLKLSEKSISANIWDNFI